ncbi:hypothetical protein [Acinetobacter sp.]|uniref:hypothetical protein n=1 Tax=Acinetobacter sp. TaxID=472 RepID=UPI0035B3095C
MNIRLLFLAPLCALLISACTQTDPLLENHPSYIGAWKSEQSELIIKASGEVLYSHKEYAAHHRAREASSSSASVFVKANISSFDGQSFSIGQGQGELSKRFVVNRAPYREKGQWKMTLNGEHFIRQ